MNWSAISFFVHCDTLTNFQAHVLIYSFIKNIVLKLCRKITKFDILLSNIVVRKQALFTKELMTEKLRARNISNCFLFFESGTQCFCFAP